MSVVVGAYRQAFIAGLDPDQATESAARLISCAK
jgi:hypothetical protein